MIRMYDENGNVVDIVKHDRDVYNNAINDFVNKIVLKYYGVQSDELNDKYYLKEIVDTVEKMAEQLKGEQG